MKLTRCFFCLPLPADLTTALEAWIQQARVSVPQARWVRRDTLHVTLRFCGEIPQRTVDRLASRAEAALADELSEPPVLRMGWTGTFGRPPKVLWGGLEGETGRLARLNALLEDLCRSEGLEPERRRFSPHLTLARFSFPPEELRLPPWNFSGRTWRAETVIFMSSRLTPAGPRYAPIKIYGRN
ncbi:MAG: RNA 2',3'-cyclic phosphodiesterase [Pyramidobacter sp.]